MKNINEAYITRCLELGRLGGNQVLKNPNVGAVIVYNNQIIGEGYHEAYGEPHAEVNAFESVSSEDRHLIKDSTIYVSLEPCCIHGKTPPCTDRIIKEGIKKVVIATTDPNSKIDGKSIPLLEQEGIKVISAVKSEEGRVLIAPFSKNLIGRPYIILKWAQSSEGYITSKGTQSKLSNPFSDTLTHIWRSEVDGILVGHNTVRIDNPRLDVRHVSGANPHPVVLSNDTESLRESYIFNQEKEPYVYSNDHPNEMLSDLFSKGIYRLLVEGGAKTHKYFIEHNLWDEARIIRTKVQLDKGIRSPRIQGKRYKSLKVASDTIDYLRPFD